LKILKKEDTKSSDKFRIAETATFRGKIEKPSVKKLYIKIKDVVYPQLEKNPFFGPNIKKLKGEWEGVYRFRLGNFRLFYVIDLKRKIIFVLDVGGRKDIYRKR